MTDRMRYESKKAFAKAKESDEALTIGLVPFAEAMARWAAKRHMADLLAKRKSARENNRKPKDFEP